jgi:hypothetical protein
MRPAQSAIDRVVALDVLGAHMFADFEFEPTRPAPFGSAELASFARRYLLRSGTIRRLTD